VANVRALVIALPGPVDDRNGTVVRPTLMPGWDGYPVAAELADRFGCPVEVHNDVNMMAAGEALNLSADALPMIYLKVGSGLGCGIVLPDGSLLHGKDGGAGDIAHIPAPGRPEVLCECGNFGCMDAVCSVRAIIRDLAEIPGVLGDAPRNSRTLVELLRRGEANAVHAMREAASTLGEAVVLLVHLFNPATILIGGLVTYASDDVVASIRGTVYQRALPLATRSLSIRPGQLQHLAGVTGALRRAVEMAFSPEALRLASVVSR
jgi:predicted NBD/HSP70 family sugar kinase